MIHTFIQDTDGTKETLFQPSCQQKRRKKKDQYHAQEQRGHKIPRNQTCRVCHGKKIDSSFSCHITAQHLKGDGEQKDRHYDDDPEGDCQTLAKAHPFILHKKTSVT